MNTNSVEKRKKKPRRYFHVSYHHLVLKINSLVPLANTRALELVIFPLVFITQGAKLQFSNVDFLTL